MALIGTGAGPHHLDRWDDIRYVLAAAKMGSFFSAGQSLATSQSTVSRRIQYLENRLGTKIFERHAQGIRLTPVGTDLVERAQAMADAADGIERYLCGSDSRLGGTVRLTAPDGLLTHWLVPLLHEFRGEYPSVRVDLISGTVDLCAGEVDIAIRMSAPVEPRVVALKAADVRFTLFAAQSYIDSHGVPASMSQLETHWIVDHTGQLALGQLDPWRQLVKSHLRVACHSDTSSAFMAALRAGFGIGLCPDFYRMVAPDLVPIALDTECWASLWLMSHEETNGNARTRAVLDFLRQRFRRDHGVWFNA